MKKCPRCGFVNNDINAACTNCGTPLPAAGRRPVNRQPNMRPGAAPAGAAPAAAGSNAAVIGISIGAALLTIIIIVVVIVVSTKGGSTQTDTTTDFGAIQTTDNTTEGVVDEPSEPDTYDPGSTPGTGELTPIESEIVGNTYHDISADCENYGMHQIEITFKSNSQAEVTVTDIYEDSTNTETATCEYTTDGESVTFYAEYSTGDVEYTVYEIEGSSFLGYEASVTDSEGNSYSREGLLCKDENYKQNDRTSSLFDGVTFLSEYIAESHSSPNEYGSITVSNNGDGFFKALITSYHYDKDVEGFTASDNSVYLDYNNGYIIIEVNEGGAMAHYVEFDDEMNTTMISETLVEDD